MKRIPFATDENGIKKRIIVALNEAGIVWESRNDGRHLCDSFGLWVGDEDYSSAIRVLQLHADYAFAREALSGQY